MRIYILTEIIQLIYFEKDVLIMAKPIGETPTLYGEDALRILRKMNEPPTEKEKDLVEKIKSQRIVLF